jgi:hypothetical protein
MLDISMLPYVLLFFDCRGCHAVAHSRLNPNIAYLVENMVSGGVDRRGR